MRLRRAALLVTVATGLVAAAPVGRAQAPRPPQRPAGVPSSFDTVVKPMLDDVCTKCHNETKATAGLNLLPYTHAGSLETDREAWERIFAKLRDREMPPSDEEQPPEEQMAALVTFVQAEFDRADKALKPDPGRVPTHRLNRAEYENTIRDLLGVDFRATEAFPADDSGYGFDNNGDVLTVSPALMQQYLSSAERIAARAVGGDPWPVPGFFTRRDRVRRVADGTIELREILDHDADYVIRIAITGHRGDKDNAVNLVISVDGAPVKSVMLPVQISAVNKQGGATQRAVQEVRVPLTGNEHVFRAEFVNDADLAKIAAKSRTDAGVNIFPEFIEVAGPFPSPMASTMKKKPFLVCDPATGAVCVKRILTGLARRAYRRPVTPTEVAALANVFTRARAAGYTPAQSLQFSVQAMLVSPQFLFRIERDPAPGTYTRVSDVELASRLSYFIWSSMPDEELLRLGETNRLHLPTVLQAQVTRMLGDRKSIALAENFAGQWLETRSLDAVKRDSKRFPEWNPDLRDAMRTETRLFFDAVLRDNRPISEFIDARYTFLNGLLAKHYGIAGVEGPDFRRVELATDQRGGILTHASVLTVSSYPTRTSVVLRGKYVLDNVLNSPPPPPPADVPALDEAAVGVAKSLREQMGAHRTMPLCASCHTKMDPLGFAFENYDAIGRWRTDDGKFPIDASGSFPSGKSFSGAAELRTLLREKMPDFTKILAEKMLTYALGRGVESYDRLVVRALVQQVTVADYKLQTLVQGIAKSLPFQHRRGERVSATTSPASKIALSGKTVAQEARRR